MSISRVLLELKAREKGITINELMDQIDKKKNPNRGKLVPQRMGEKPIPGNGVCSWA